MVLLTLQLSVGHNYGKRRAARNAGEVIQHHYDVAVTRMGNEHRRWYYDADGCLCEL